MRGCRAATRSLAHAPSFGGGAVVMATGVVSLCFHTSGPQWLSRSLFAVAAVVWAALMLVVIGRALTDRRRWADEAGAASSLTLAAGTAVLGSRLAASGRTGLATALLAAGTLLSSIFLPPVLRRRPIATGGTDLLVCVVPQSLAALAARLARMTHQRWELYAAAAAYALGLVAYAVTVRRFELRQILTGAGDQRARRGGDLGGPHCRSAPRPRPGAGGLRNIGTKTGAKPSLALVGG